MPMASAELSRRAEKVVGYPPLAELDELQRREFHEALLEADSFEDLPGKWQAAVVAAEEPGRSCAWVRANSAHMGGNARFFSRSLGPREHEALELIEQHPGITARELAARLGVTTSRVWQIVRRLERGRSASGPCVPCSLREKSRPTGSKALAGSTRPM
jgi:DNA-binding CsgD family transcriptional regulator